MKPETPLMRKIMLFLSSARTKVFRNNVGCAFYENKNGEVRRVKYGLYNGSGDVIGWHTIRITKDMVGKQVAVFLSIEIKTHEEKENGTKKSKRETKTEKDQRVWRNNVIESGGIAGVAKSPHEAKSIISNYKPL